MRPYYQDNSVTIFNGDVLSVLPTLPAESVHCVITSPPYWGLRDYGTAQWEGGDEGCNHLEQKGTTRGGPASTITVLDPFSGAGTALFVAKELGRKAIGIELKSEYIDLASARMAQEVLDL